MRFRLVASDLDGTLLRTDDSLSARNRAAIHEVAALGLFVYATGRPPRMVQPVAELSGHRGLAVCSNGAVTIDLTDESIVDQQTLSSTQSLRIVDAIQSVVPDASFAVDRPAGFCHDPKYVPLFWQPPDTIVAPIRELLLLPAFKILFRHSGMDRARFLSVVAAVGDLGTVTYGSTASVPGSNTLIEVMAAGVSKATALARICERKGLTRHDVVAFGDMPNDIDMIDWAGHGVAMANAHPEAKAVADEIALSNDEDGVARVLERELAASR